MHLLVKLSKSLVVTEVSDLCLVLIRKICGYGLNAVESGKTTREVSAFYQACREPGIGYRLLPVAFEQ